MHSSVRSWISLLAGAWDFPKLPGAGNFSTPVLQLEQRYPEKPGGGHRGWPFEFAVASARSERVLEQGFKSGGVFDFSETLGLLFSHRLPGPPPCCIPASENFPFCNHFLLEPDGGRHINSTTRHFMLHLGGCEGIGQKSEVGLWQRHYWNDGNNWPGPHVTTPRNSQSYQIYPSGSCNATFAWDWTARRKTG
jgi:hypothetical protein